MINISFSGIKNSFGSTNLINFNFSNSVFKPAKKTEKHFDWGKIHLISPFARFCGNPDFEIENPTMNKRLVKPFYDVTIKLILDFDFTPSQFEYYKSNLGAENIHSKSKLIEYFISQRDNTTRNDSRYYLGFRSIYSVLNNNLESISYEYVWELNEMLEPFFTTYRHKELLIPGLSLIEK